MARVKSALEMALEKAEKIDSLTKEEKEEIEERERIKSVLAAFYRGELDKNKLWQALKGSKPHLLKEAQCSMADSIRMNSTPEEFQLRRDGLLAIESLKEKKNTTAIESVLTVIKKLQREFEEIKDQASRELRSAVEQNPQLRMRPVQTPDGRVVYQASLSVDEAVKARMAEFLSEHERRYEVMFNNAIEKLKREIK